MRPRERVLERLVEIERRELCELALEVHSGLLQDIVGTDFLLQGVENLGQEEAAKRLDQARKSLRSAMDRGRRLISELRPMVVDQQGIVNAINFYAAELENRSRTLFTLCNQLNGDILDAFWCQIVFRIVQAAMNNVESHSQAASAEIMIRDVDGQFEVSVIDGGVGFDVAASEQSLGLRCMRERAELMGGTVRIQSQQDVGTTVKITVPLPSLAASDLACDR